MGDDMLTIGMVVGLDYRDVSLSPHDLLQELKSHPKIRELLLGGAVAKKIAATREFYRTR